MERWTYKGSKNLSIELIFQLASVAGLKWRRECQNTSYGEKVQLPTELPVDSRHFSSSFKTSPDVYFGCAGRHAYWVFFSQYACLMMIAWCDYQWGTVNSLVRNSESCKFNSCSLFICSICSICNWCKKQIFHDENEWNWFYFAGASLAV